MNVLDLARADIRALEPYASARTEGHGGATFLNANESPWPPWDDAPDWNRYPDPQPAALVSCLAALYGVSREQLLVGRGSDEGIDLLVRAFCRAGRDAVLVSPPTFGMYAVCARVQGAEVVTAPLRDDFALDVDAVCAAVTPAVKLVFVCAPNNPSGAGVPRTAIVRLAEALTGRALLVVDEAYAEFAGARAGEASVADCVGRYPNLVVLRTLSKAWALAGVRVGALLADASVVALLRKLMPPYPLPAPCVDAALRALSGDGVRRMQARVAAIRGERDRLAKALAQCACVHRVLPSEANFLAVRFDDPVLAFAALRCAGVVVRDARRHCGLADALRITVGAPAENDRVLDVLRVLASPSGVPSARAVAEQPS